MAPVPKFGTIDEFVKGLIKCETTEQKLTCITNCSSIETHIRPTKYHTNTYALKPIHTLIHVIVS